MWFIAYFFGYLSRHTRLSSFNVLFFIIELKIRREFNMCKFDVNDYKNMICLLDTCIDDYLYLIDIKNDTYFISPHAMKRFKIPSYEFSNPIEVHKQFVFYKDYDGLVLDLNKLIKKEKEFHSLNYRWLDQKNLPIWINCRGRAICDEDGNVNYIIGCVNEIGKSQMADNASGLLRENTLRNLILPLKENYSQGFILRLGIDHFKLINEKFGLKYGDYILKETAKCLRKHLAKHQHLYKVVGDEYIIIDLESRQEEAICLFNNIRNEISQFIESINYNVYFTISAGILLFEDYPTSSYNTMMKWSEFALNKAKKEGKNRYYVYNEADYQVALRKTELTKILHKAVKDNFEGFEVYFQPIIDVNKLVFYSMESLLRFHCDEFGTVSPGEFIPLLEESNLIIPVGKWVLEKSLQALVELKDLCPHILVHVNLSYVQVLKSQALDDIIDIINQYQVEKNRLVIELTESVFVKSDEYFSRFCKKIKDRGILLAIDDFGTGYSNFHYIYKLNPDYIKIDRQLMKNALTNEYENILLSYIIDMIHGVEGKICIEGIEKKDELNRILKMNPDYIQGFYYSRPCSLAKLKEKIRRNFVLFCE